MACHFASKSSTRCVTFPNPQTLDELDMASMRIPGKHMKISWLILSRVGIHYLSSTFGSWTICQAHRKEFLDAWQVSSKCSHPNHNIFDNSSVADQLVTMVMSVKMLQNAGQVVPISSKFCKNCYDDFNRMYGSKPGEKVVVIVPKPKPQSPFCPEKPTEEMIKGPSNVAASNVIHNNIQSRGVLMTSNPPEPPSKKIDVVPEINIKTELIIEDTDTGNNNESIQSENSNVMGSKNSGKQTKPTVHPGPQTPIESPVRIRSSRTTRSEPTKSIATAPTIARNSSTPVATPLTSARATPVATPLTSTRATPVATPLTSARATPVATSTLASVKTAARVIPVATPLSSTRGTRSKAAKKVNVQEQVQDEIEDDNESILSHDSDDDPTWGPAKKNDKNNKEQLPEVNNLVQTFQPRKRKRIGPDMILKNKKPKEIVVEPSPAPPPKPASPPKAKRPRGRPRKNKSLEESEISDSEECSTDSDIMDTSEEKNRIEGAGGTDYHYFCKICQISFYKHTAFRHHVLSSVDLHKQLKKKERKRKEAELEYECVDCCIAFQDRKSHQTHMVEEHSESAGNPFYCQKCNVYLKSESAFKSHNSKLHLERREKTYYCRECDETFTCLVKHSLHIVVHRTWTQEEMGMQCRICGKVFTRNQTLPFHRHLATHDTEPETVCGCSDCVEPTTSAENDTPEKDPLDVKNVKTTQKKNLLKKMQSQFLNDEDDDDETDDEQVLKPYECGKCKSKFSTIDHLEKHVAEKHSGKSPPASSEKVERPSKKNKNEISKEIMTADAIDEVIDEFAKDVERMENTNKTPTGSPNKVNSKPKVKKLNRGPVPERNWQECPDRNWAAEFGYGGKSSIGPTRDILSQMALTFKIGGDDDDEEDTDDKNTPGYDSGVSVDDEDKIFRTRGFKGNVKASLNRAPRTLSSSSLRTRKRMEALMRKAREFMKKNKGNSGNSSISNYEKVTGSKRTTTPNIKKLINASTTKKSTNTVVTPAVIHEDTTATTVTTAPTIEKPPAEGITSNEMENKNKPSSVEVNPKNKEQEVVKVAQEVVEKVAKLPTEKEVDKPADPEPEEEVVVEPEVPEEDLHLELEDGDLEEEEVLDEDEEEEEEDEDFDGISDGSDDDDNDGLLIPLENGWVCEKRMSDPEVHSYTTHFWSPDGQRHGSLSSIKTYGTKNKLKLNMFIFERALKTNPHTK